MWFKVNVIYKNFKKNKTPVSKISPPFPKFKKQHVEAIYSFLVFSKLTVLHRLIKRIIEILLLGFYPQSYIYSNSNEICK